MVEVLKLQVMYVTRNLSTERFAFTFSSLSLPQPCEWTSGKYIEVSLNKNQLKHELATLVFKCHRSATTFNAPVSNKVCLEITHLVVVCLCLLVISLLYLLFNILFAYLFSQLYTFLETTLDTLVLLPSFIKFFQEAKNHSTSPGNLAVTFLAFVINLAFALSLLCFLIMHASLLSSNTTSVEVYEKKRAVRWRYDLGQKKNFEQVFGTKKALWFFPLFSKEDLENIPALQGLDFPTRSDVEV
ncbi:hypothetical protein F0562_014938 [Nyssa sinensis]|uniref:Protein S-acyltransferase n=1 Tax=Nyssa sinensis TaxID=561372 RepID=A0A5J4ZQR0_9ASTE|nr:hypothetical protein F0562_014938 [Nyssa sinensis]